MQRITTWVVLCGMVGIALLLGGCEGDDTVAAQGEAVVSGMVIDASSGVALAEVTITAQSVGAGKQTATTDASGNFRVTFPIDSTSAATLLLQKSGYRDTTFVVGLRSGYVNILTVQLSPKSAIVPPGGAGSSGTAQTIAFLGADPAEVSVYGVGGKETSILSWEVRDSLGLPIDAAHKVALRFSSQNGPNGGEYISPPVVETNTSGQAFTTFNAGTKSGVVQISASATVGSRTITSSPVRMVIHGGFAVQSHFSVGPVAHNFPAMGYLGKSLAITVLAGDVYSNPVAAGTAIYFRSSAGVVQPMVFTSQDGFGTVLLYSGNPEPLGANASPAFGAGYHYVVARTLGQGGIVVQDSTLILWSGAGRIENLSPMAFDVANAGTQAFTFNVLDGLGHPLASGTKIQVKATIPPPATEGEKQNQVAVSFGVNGEVTLPDLLFPGAGSTEFGFTLKDGTWSITDATPVTLTISVTGPNVTSVIAATISGIVR